MTSHSSFRRKNGAPTQAFIWSRRNLTHVTKTETRKGIKIFQLWLLYWLTSDIIQWKQRLAFHILLLVFHIGTWSFGSQIFRFIRYLVHDISLQQSDWFITLSTLRSNILSVDIILFVISLLENRRCRAKQEIFSFFSSLTFWRFLVNCYLSCQWACKMCKMYRHLLQCDYPNESNWGLLSCGAVLSLTGYMVLFLSLWIKS